MYFVLSSTTNITYAIPMLLSLVFLESFQNALNLHIDAEVDKMNKPDRPLPSGKLSKKVSKKLIVSFLFFSIFFLSFYFNLIVLLVFILDLLLVISYSTPPLMLRNKIWGTMLYTSHYSIFPFFYAVLISEIFFSELYVIPLIYVFITIYSSIILKDYEDVTGDKKFNYKSLPIIFGVKKSVKIHSILFLVPFILVIFAKMSNFVLFLLPLPLALYMVKLLHNGKFRRVYILGHFLSAISVIILAWCFI
jgi:geranylgeranylglycerol-phosphate geranylgeranyltransferase